jgi:hypothetical protein
MLSRTRIVVAVTAILIGVAATAAAAVPGRTVDPVGPAAVADCAVTWGSGAKTGPAQHGSSMVDLRAGQTECYDRLVFDLVGATGGYVVSYVDEVRYEGSGQPVAVRGGARLSVTVLSPAYDESFAPTYTYDDPAELIDVSGFQTFRQVAWAGSWEATTTVGVGVRAQLPFRVFMLPNRIVIDVAHRW